MPGPSAEAAAMAPASPRAQALGAFYRAHAPTVQRAVARHVNASRPTLEDACQNAWAKLLRRDDIALDCGGVSWLITVAIREGWHLSRHDREGSLRAAGAGPAGEDRVSELQDLAPGPDELAVARAEHAQRVADLHLLKARERRDLFLHALGYGYEEIALRTDSTYTAVNRRLSEGRAHLRRLAGERAQA